MASVSETLVREFFEFHGFLVLQLRKYISPDRREEREADLVVYNPHPEPGGAELPFVLAVPDIKRITHAVVVVKGWHTETFSASVLDSLPDMFRLVGISTFSRAAAALDGSAAPVTRLLVVPELPSSPAARTKSIEGLRGRGVDCVITFRTILSDLIRRVEVNRNYQKADLLQVIRILKNYGFLKVEDQLELFARPRRRPRRPRKE